MNHYNLIDPTCYEKYHISFINQISSSIRLLSKTNSIIMGIKDINSRHIIATDKYARTIGLVKGTELCGRFDKDLPCESIARYSETFVAQDLELLKSFDVNKTVTALNIHNYSDGFRSRIIKKNLLIHQKSKSILGVLYHGYDIELSDILNILPACFLRSNKEPYLLANRYDNKINLTEYEKEICFLILQNWDMKNIADFMNQTRPLKINRSADTIVKKKNYICHKLGLNSILLESLKSYLIANNLHKKIKMPNSFYSRIIGSIKFED